MQLKLRSIDMLGKVNERRGFLRATRIWCGVNQQSLRKKSPSARRICRGSNDYALPRTRLKSQGPGTKRLIIRVFPVANNREKKFGTPGWIRGL